MTETSRHGNCAQVEMSYGERSNEGCKVVPVHRKVAGENLAEALFELGLNELNEDSLNVLLHPCL